MNTNFDDVEIEVTDVPLGDRLLYPIAAEVFGDRAKRIGHSGSTLFDLVKGVVVTRPAKSGRPR